MSSRCQLSQSRYNGMRCLGMRGSERTTSSFARNQRGKEELQKFPHLSPSGVLKLACRERTTRPAKSSLDSVDGDWLKKPSHLSGQLGKAYA